MDKAAFAWNYVLDHEDPKRSGVTIYDGGGETRFGIAQKYHPSEYPALAEMPIADALARAQAIFTAEYWQPVFEQIADLRVAAKLVDIDFNLGAAIGRPKGVGIMVTQMACVDMGKSVPETAFFGPITLAAVNGVDADQLLTKMCFEEQLHIQQEYQERNLAVPRGLIVRAQDRPMILQGAAAD